MSEGPSMETLMMLGAMAPKSQEEGKPTVDVALTAVEIQAMAVLSNMRFQRLFIQEGEDHQKLAGIYLGITTKLMLAALHISAKEAFKPDPEKMKACAESKDGHKFTNDDHGICTNCGLIVEKP